MFCIYKTQEGSNCETVEQWDSRLLKSVGGAVGRKHTILWFSVCWTWGLLHWHVDIPEQNVTFCASQLLLFLLTNEMTCSTFLYSTVNMLCGSLNRLLTVWQCTEILLYSNRWGVLWTESKVTVLRYPLLLLLIIIIIIIIVIVIFPADPKLAL
jgi:hypothetical protein